MWHLSCGDISVLMKFQFCWHFSFADISVLLTFQFLSMIYRLPSTFYFYCRLSIVYNLLSTDQHFPVPTLIVWPSLEHCLLVLTFLVKAYNRQSNNEHHPKNMEPLQILVGLFGIGNLEIGNKVIQHKWKRNTPHKLKKFNHNLGKGLEKSSDI